MCDLEDSFPINTTQATENVSQETKINCYKFLVANREQLFQLFCEQLLKSVQEDAVGRQCDNLSQMQEWVSLSVTHYYDDLRNLKVFKKDALQFRRERNIWTSTFQQMQLYCENQRRIASQNLMKVQMDCNKQTQHLWRANKKLFATIEELHRQLRGQQVQLQNYQFNQQVFQQSLLDSEKARGKFSGMEQKISSLENVVVSLRATTENYSKCKQLTQQLSQDHCRIEQENNYLKEEMRLVQMKLQTVKAEQARSAGLEECQQLRRLIREKESEVSSLQSIAATGEARMERMKRESKEINGKYASLRQKHIEGCRTLEQLTQKVLQLQLELSESKKSLEEHMKSLENSRMLIGSLSQQVQQSKLQEEIVRSAANTEADDLSDRMSTRISAQLQQQSEVIQISTVSRYLSEFMDVNLKEDKQFLAFDTLLQILKMNDRNAEAVREWKRKLKCRSREIETPSMQPPSMQPPSMQPPSMQPPSMQPLNMQEKLLQFFKGDE